MELVADLRIDKNARSGAAQIDAHEYRWGRTPLLHDELWRSD